jgi:pimeloyl-ACP methyl ester carboxylesterase
MTPNRDDICRLRDGRALAFAEWGVPDGRPVLALHGAPGSRLWCPDDFDPGKTTTECGVRLITVDRPGYGRSDPLPGRTLLGWADDVEQLLDALSIVRCPVVGVSGGGPHAMACAARLPQRFTRLGAVGGAGPIFQVPGLWEQLDEDWRAELELAAQDRSRALEAARRRSEWLVDDPESAGDPANWPEVDRWLGQDPAMRDAFVAVVREAGRQGIDGYVWDRLSFTLPWGFSLNEIEIETWLWQGEQDSMTDRAEFEMLCREIPRSHCVLYSGQGHLIRGHWGEIFEALLAT